MSAMTIAIATDFSEESRRAFGPAAAIARRFDARVLVVHLAQIPPEMVSPWPELGPFLIDDEVFENVERRLLDLVAAEDCLRDLAPQTRVVRAEAIEALLGVLDTEGVGLLVVASHGHSRWKRILLGSFAESTLRSSPCPVLVWRPSGAADAAPAAFEARRILVPHDFTPHSERASALALEWARRFGAKARLHFVVEHPANVYGYAATLEGSFTEYLERIRLEALRRFREAIRDSWQGIEVEALATVGHPEEELLRSAREFAADLIVLGTHDRKGLERFFLGSVARDMVRSAPCPVLAVRETAAHSNS